MKKKSNKIKQPQKKFPASNKLSHRKKVLFSIFMLLLPLLFIIIVEIFLIFVNYDGDLKLVKNHVTNDNYYQLNYEIGRKYFPKHQVTTSISYDVFLKDKPENSYRIFVFGGSSAAGYPYMNNGAFSRMLRTRLAAQFPQRLIEVVNTAMPAVNSFTVLDFVKELVDYQPDAFLFYTGHNEFYGALGVGSTEALGQSRRAIKLYMALQNYRIVRLTRNFINWLRGTFVRGANKNEDGDATLMERMVGEKEIAYRSPTYNRALQFFRDNLAEIIEISQKENIAVMFAELVANVCDQQPFVSIFTDEGQKQQWRNIVEQGFTHQKNKRYQDALQQYQRAKKMDAQPALLYYLQGQCYEGLAQIDSARVNYYRSKDLDGLRFRAAEDFNDVIRQLGAAEKIAVVPLIKIYENASAKKLIGDNLMTDHLHPNLNGFFLMAKGFCETMRGNGLIASDWEPKLTAHDSTLKKQLGVTELDLFSAQLKIDILKGGWPFEPKGTINNALNFRPKTQLEKIVWQWQRHELNWEEAHVKMAEFYTRQHDYENAAEEYRALTIGTPYNESPLLKLAEIRILQQRYNDAIAPLKKSLTITDSHYANKWLGTILLNNGEAEQAIKHLTAAIRKKPADYQSMYNLAGAYHLAGRTDLALAQCKRLAKINPNYPGLRRFILGLQQLNKQKTQN